MKTYNLNYTDVSQLKEFIEQNKIKKSKNILIQIFSGKIDEDILSKISNNLKSILPSSNIIGTTTAGEIYKGKMYDESIIISFSVFDDTIVRSGIYEIENENLNVKKAIDELVFDDTKVLIIFSDGLLSNGEEIIKNISKIKPDLIIAGGRAGDNQQFKKTFVFNDTSILESGIVMASLSSKNLIVNNNYMLNWQTIGQDMVVTKSQGNCLIEINHLSAVEIYRRYLGNEIVKSLPSSGIEFPLIFEKNGVKVARAPIAVLDNGSLIVAGNLEEGTKVKFGFGDLETIKDEGFKCYKALKQCPVESTFIYSCSARKALLNKDLELEFGLIENIAPSVGFFTYGEYFYNDKRNDLLNITTTTLSLSETSNVNNIDDIVQVETKTDRTLSALSNLVKVTSNELTSAYNVLNQAQIISAIGSWDWDITNNTLWWSDEIYNLFGISKDCNEASYEVFLNHIHPKDIDMVNNAMKVSLKNKDIPYQIEHRLVSVDGAIKVVMAQAEILRDEQGNPTRMTGTIQDITEEKRNKQLLLDKTKEQENLLSLFDKGNSVLFRWNNDKNWSIDYVSSNVVNLLGYTKEEFLNNSIDYASCIVKDDIERVFEEVANGQKSKDDFFRHAPYRIITKDGSIKWVLDYTVVTKNDKGDITHFLGYIMDITSQQENQKRLEDSEFRWKFAVDGNGDGLWDWDLKSNEVYYSTRWKEMLGYSEDDIENTLDEWKRLVHPDDLQNAYKVVQDHLSGNTDHYSLEFRLLCKDSSYKWILARGMVVQKDNDGNPLRVIGTHADISEQKKISQELLESKEIAENANKAKSEFLANMSHEIRTPLNGIVGFVDILKENIKDPNNKKYLKIIDESSHHLLGVIADILDFSKIESGKLEIVNEDFNIDELCSSIALFSAKAEEKKIYIHTNIDKNMPRHLNSDLLRIKQILTNLLSNAIKFTSEGKNIFIDIDYNENKLSVSVKDEGKGISPNKLIHIFEAFNQEDSSITREYGGTGLGLSICNELVKLLGGVLSVRSKEKQGSEFYFKIPIEISKNNTLKTKIDMKNVKLQGKILIVEDNKANQEFMKVLLKKLGLNFEIAQNGQESISMYKENRYDLILMDENMPKMSGIEATRNILAYEHENNITHTPIVALTANALKGDKEKFLEAGMDEYLTKPVNKKALIEVLSKYLV
ncbi:MAG: PAS domain-containing protein [Campylobacterota bacterium]|nr:PAS domain-containing protein [Campylobacterota bacterium]